MNQTAAFVHWIATSPFVALWGWTLVHSLWEFCAVAGILALALRALGSASSRARYAAAAGALLALVVLPIATFHVVSAPTPVLPIGRPSFASPSTSSSTAFQPAETAALNPASIAEPRSLLALPDLTVLLRPTLPWLIGLWALGVLVLSLWHFGGWIALQRLRSLGVSPVEPAVRDALSQLAARLGVTRPVAILKSTLVQTPILIGFLRPLILAPAAVLAGLSRADLEAILAHELAHVRRHDYLINLLQAAIDTLLFYHPAVWWVSRQLRQERENCCDDVAAAICGDCRAYARALVSIEELRPPGNSLALAATGGDGPLSQRIQRLLGKSNRRAARRTASIAAVCLSLSAVLSPLLLHRVSAQAVTPPTIARANPEAGAAVPAAKPTLKPVAPVSALPPTAASSLRAKSAIASSAATPQLARSVVTSAGHRTMAAPAQSAPSPVKGSTTAILKTAPHLEVGSDRTKAAARRTISPTTRPPLARRLIAEVRSSPATAKTVAVAQPVPFPPPLHDDGDGHLVLYDAARLPMTLTGPQAQRLMIKAVHAFGESNLRVIYRVSFNPAAMIFTYRTARGGAVGHYPKIRS